MDLFVVNTLLPLCWSLLICPIIASPAPVLASHSSPGSSIIRLAVHIPRYDFPIYLFGSSLLTPDSLPVIALALALDVIGLVGLNMLAYDAFRRWPTGYRVILATMSLVEVGQTGECHLRRGCCRLIFSNLGVCVGILLWLHKGGESGKSQHRPDVPVPSMKHPSPRKFNPLDVCRHLGLARSNYHRRLRWASLWFLPDYVAQFLWFTTVVISSRYVIFFTGTLFKTLASLQQPPSSCS